MDNTLLPFAFSSLPLPGDTSSEQSLGWAKLHIQKCNSEHSCYDSAILHPLPNRVLDVGSSEPEIRLYMTHNEPGLYICLSHCWGKLQINGKTTKENLERNMKGIELDSLPKTFQEAVGITRELGVRFLWIDALCIIQEDDADWLKEAPLMINIYENAYLTIAATASPDGNGGCYRTTPPEAREREFSYSGGQSGVQSTVYVREAASHFGNRAPDEEKAREFPLLDRAWVYQEQILSSRMLHFCNRELFFECRQLADCQCGEVTDFKSTTKVLLNQILEKTNPKAPRVLFWPDFIEDYSRLKITFDKDRLPAISGIARKMAQLNPGDLYLAGMWKSTCLESLSWAILRGQVRRYRPAQPRAPSWSWASAFGGITWRDAKKSEHPGTGEIFLDENKKFYASLVRAECFPLDGDPFGVVTSGILTLRAKVTPCQLTWSTVGVVNYQEPGWKIAAFDCLPLDTESRFYFQIGPDYLFHLDMAPPLDIYCLWLHGHSYGTWDGLVLQKVDKGFERIACFKVELKGEGAVPWDFVEAVDMTVDII